MLEYLTVVVVMQITLLIVYKLTQTLLKEKIEINPPKRKNRKPYQQAM
jgi:hypothetical protein